MKDLKSAAFHLERANTLFDSAQESHPRRGSGVVAAAINLAECSISGLKALLYYNGAVVLDEWDVKTLISVAMSAHIKVPYLIIDMADTLQEFSDDTLYEVDELKYARAKYACSKFLSELNYTIGNEAVAKLRELTGVSVLRMSNDDLLHEYWREL